MNAALHYSDLIVILLYFSAVVFLGIFRHQRDKKSTSEFVLAGRKLSLPGFVATLVTTWYGGILGVGENTFNFGIQTWFIFGLPYYVFAFIFAFTIAPRIRRSNMISIPDHFHTTYGKPSGIISAFYILLLSSPAPYILSIGIVIQYAIGIPLGIATLSAAVLSLVYIWFGGFRAVVRTDILQFILMFGSFLLILYFAWIKIGSPGELVTRLPADHLSPLGGHSLQYVIVWFLIAMWTFVDPGFYQRCAAAKSPATARNGLLVSILFWSIFDFMTILTGLYAKAFLSPEAAPLFSYPMLGRELLPPIFYGLFLTGILATIMSTIDSLGLISSFTFGRDIISRLKFSNLSDDNEKTTPIIRLGLIISAIIAILLALMIPSVVKLWYTVGSIIIPGLIIPFLMTFNKDLRPTMRSGSAVVLILAPVLVSTVWFVWGAVGKGYPLDLEPFFPGMLTSIVLSLRIFLRPATPIS
ncbi:MAG: sodium:solute symporter family protein [Candidatus Neomarinimicrobiota bacterium]